MKDTTINHPETYSTIENYIGESNYNIFYTKDYLRIENRQRVISEPLIVIEAKAFKTKDSNSIIGIRYSYSSPYNFSDAGYKFFKVTKDSTVSDITFSVFEEPALKDFFSLKKDFKKFKGSSCIQSLMSFQIDTNGLIVSSFFTCENSRNNEDKKYMKMYELYDKVEKVSYYYWFKEDINRFVLDYKKVDK